MLLENEDILMIKDCIDVACHESLIDKKYAEILKNKINLKIDPDKLIAELKSIEINYDDTNPVVEKYLFDYMDKLEECVEKAHKEWSSTERLLFSGNSYFSLYQGRWYLNLNDTWYYASADGEFIEKNEYEEIADWFRKYGRAGLLYWAYLKRKTYPQIHKNKAKVVAIENLEKELLEIDRRNFEFQQDFKVKNLKDNII